jgi:acyl-CoA carboxylase subunit beta
VNGRADAARSARSGASAQAGGAAGGRARAAVRAVASGFTEFEPPAHQESSVSGGDADPDGPLGWRGYGEARERARERTGESESVVCGTARVGGADGSGGAEGSSGAGAEGGLAESDLAGGDLGGGDLGVGARAGGVEVVLISFEFGYLGGSLGARTGDRIAAAYEYARRHRKPLVSLIATGGSRMQEGMVALGQLQRVARESALTRRAGVPQIAVLRDPATGGGWATLGAGADVVLALPGAQVAFAGSRVRPVDADPSAYTAEGQYAAGHIDQIVEQPELGTVLERWLTLLTGGSAVHSGGHGARGSADPAPVPAALAGTDPSEPSEPSESYEPSDAARRSGRAGARRSVPSSGQEAVARARGAERPRAAAYLDDYFDWRQEVRGDRCGGVDAGMLCGFGRREGRTFAYAAQTGSATRPAGFRTAARLIRTADRLGIPVLTLIDTPGAANDADAESAGAGPAIAEVFAAVAEAEVPVTSLLIGEGGSGGALALAAPGRLWVTPDSYFSVIAPELAAAILKRPPEQVAATADELMLRPQDVVRLGIARAVVEVRAGPSQGVSRHGEARGDESGDGRSDAA